MAHHCPRPAALTLLPSPHCPRPSLAIPLVPVSPSHPCAITVHLVPSCPHAVSLAAVLAPPGPWPSPHLAVPLIPISLSHPHTVLLSATLAAALAPPQPLAITPLWLSPLSPPSPSRRLACAPSPTCAVSHMCCLPHAPSRSLLPLP